MGFDDAAVSSRHSIDSSNWSRVVAAAAVACLPLPSAPPLPPSCPSPARKPLCIASIESRTIATSGAPLRLVKEANSAFSKNTRPRLKRQAVDMNRSMERGSFDFFVLVKQRSSFAIRVASYGAPPSTGSYDEKASASARSAQRFSALSIASDDCFAAAAAAAFAAEDDDEGSRDEAAGAMVDSELGNASLSARRDAVGAGARAGAAPVSAEKSSSLAAAER